MKKMKLLTTIILSLSAINHAAGEVLDGQKNIKLVEISGREHIVGKIKFLKNSTSSTYQISWKDEVFGEHFLSMRPFKCFEGSTKYWCRVAYPYEIKKTVTENDLTDLEYDLMFIWKGSTEYGINMWNGVYYQMEVEDNKIIGRINEIDMDKLSAPPEKGNLRPVEEYDLEPAEPESHWLPILIIE